MPILDKALLPVILGDKLGSIPIMAIYAIALTRVCEGDRLNDCSERRVYIQHTTGV